MAKPHFAIEPQRKIRISIEGYDPQARTQAQRRKQQERRQRLARRAAAAALAARDAAPACITPDDGSPLTSQAIQTEAAAAAAPALAPEAASEPQQELPDSLS